MSQREREDPGTGVKEVIDILAKTPPERLCSLTYQLGPSTEEDIVHALCLFILHREVQALEKLQAHTDDMLAKHLSSKWQQSASQFEKFKTHCHHLQEPNSLATLARIFKIFTQHGLCDREYMILAYKRALPSESNDLEYNQFIEEAKDVCGPEIVEVLSSFSNLKLKSGFFNESNMNTSATTAQLKACSNIPSSLHTSYPYPSHLEISAPPTNIVHSIKTPASSLESGASSSSLGKSMKPEKPSNANPSCKVHGQDILFKIPQPPTKPASKTIPDDPLPEKKNKKMRKSDFEVPGKATLRCVEDAINNSAFTLLLLTNNFNRFLEMKTNSALVNSIQNQPKYNTVIPLLPQSNAMPKEEFPMVLKTLVPLVENRNFERKIQQAITPTKLKRQKEEWIKEKKVKGLKDEQKKLQRSIQQQQKENEELRAFTY
ncbi:hypothetical protein WMY93_001432 [Mugilogobius chulae]|uniref:TRIF N-terminal domain-containing protein n=1 Tax=Mugilogobius chulae TaxID=88201 RepID=A0AAW0Q813_9GOBI